MSRSNTLSLGAARSPAVAGASVAIVIAFLVSMMIPVNFNIAGLRLSPYRIFLLLVMVPALLSFLQNPSKRLIISDFFVLLYTFFIAASFAYHNNGLPTIGIFVIETLGPYFVARAYLNGVNDMRKVFTVLFFMIIALLGPAIYENLTKQPILIRFFSLFGNALSNSSAEERMGMRRAQVVFEHAILYGVFVSMAISTAYYIAGYGKFLVVRLLYLAGTVIATFTSLSAGPLVAAGFQFVLIGWDHFTPFKKNKWRYFAIGAFFFYIVLDLVVRRPVVNLLISLFTFNQGNAFTRVAQWRCGMLSVERNPIFGFGMGGEWERCAGVTNSIDNFFLAMAMRNGAPAIFCLLAAVVAVILTNDRHRQDDPRYSATQKGILFGIIGACVAGATVHFWNATYCMFMFMIGAAAWVSDRNAAPRSAPIRPEPPPRDPRNFARRIG